jgi:hypothetical protein
MGDYTFKKLNDYKVKKIKLPKQDLEVKGKDLICEPYPNIFICAHKESGKTVTLFNILKSCIDKDTEVIFFVSTLYNDPSYKEIIRYLDKKEIRHQDFTSLKENDINYLGNFINFLKNEAKQREEEEKRKENELNDDEHKMKLSELKQRHKEYQHIYNVNLLEFAEDEDTVTLKLKRKKKYLTPKYFIIFDDISAEIKTNPQLPFLLKMNRHFQSKVIISTQYVTDVPPSGRSNFNIYILFSGHNLEKLKDIYESSDPRIEFDEFVRLYHHATKEPYNFLYIDKNKGKYRKNFDLEYKL